MAPQRDRACDWSGYRDESIRFEKDWGFDAGSSCFDFLDAERTIIDLLVGSAY
jgi:hypothetical protein